MTIPKATTPKGDMALHCCITCGLFTINPGYCTMHDPRTHTTAPNLSVVNKYIPIPTLQPVPSPGVEPVPTATAAQPS